VAATNMTLAALFIVVQQIMFDVRKARKLQKVLINTKRLASQLFLQFGDARVT
jgi:hypothetical protein